MRGGHRDNAGRKSTWNNGDTQTIRVPKVFADQLIEIAKKLDRGQPLNAEIILTAIDQYITSQLTQSGGNQHKKKGEMANIENSRDWTHLSKFRKAVEKGRNL